MNAFIVNQPEPRNFKCLSQQILQSAQLVFIIFILFKLQMSTAHSYYYVNIQLALGLVIKETERVGLP